MTTHNHDTSLGMGIYFAPDDYVGIMRRIAILIIDLAVLIIVYVLFAIFLIPIIGNQNASMGLLYFGIVWTYLTILKSSRIRTVGYRLMSARIINLRGGRPSMFQMTFRLLLWAFGPFNLLFDLLWSSVDDDRQTLRDRFAGTCVINAQAEPIGTAEIQLKYYYAFGFALVYSRVMRPQDPE